MKYRDFRLLAIEPQVVKAAGRKRLTFSLIVPDVFNDPLPCELDARAVGELRQQAGRADADWQDARRLGEALATALLPDKVWNALNNAITQATATGDGVRLRLMLSGSEMNNWPWEFMVFNRAGGEAKISDFLALMPNVSLVRHTATPLPAWRVEAKPPAKLLVAVASPSGWPTLQVADESAAVARALAGSTQISVHTVEHAQRSQLPGKLNPAHLFHFAGHGKFEMLQSPVPGAYEGKASVILEDGYGDEDSLDAELLAVCLRDAGVRVAVLGACQTAQRDDVSTWSSVAEALLKAELGAVVGMQFPIRDKTALCFAQRFYGALAVGLSIDEAVAAGRVAVADSGDARGWATPVLYLRSPDGVIFPEFEASPGLATAREQVRVAIRMDIGILRGKATALKIGRIELDASDAGKAIQNVGQSLGSLNVSQRIGEITETGSAIGVEIGVIGQSGQTSTRSRDGAVRTQGRDDMTRPSPSSRATSPATRTSAVRTRSSEPEQARVELPTVDSKIEVGSVTSGQVIGTQVKQIISGRFVDARTIVEIGPEAVREIVSALLESQGVDPASVQTAMARAAPQDVSRQISALVAAQRELAAGGTASDVETAYRLGMLAAYGRDYDAALAYFRQATQTDPGCRKAFAALSWLQQSRAMSDLDAGDIDAVEVRLAEAREAAMHTDPLSASELAQRGYIYKTLAQLAESRHQEDRRDRHYAEAGRLFEQAARLDPRDAGAQNGLGNVRHASGDLDGALTAYRRAIELAPHYTAAYHDLALALEDKMRAERPAAGQWRKEALEAWTEAYRLAPGDPGFSAEAVLAIGRRISYLEHQQEG